MLPLGDSSRRVREVPIATVSIIALNIVGFVLELGGGDDFVLRWAAVPGKITSGHDLITLLTSMFMHASWSHIIGNMAFLWAFGPEMEDAMGPGRYAAFYLTGGIVAMLAQVAGDPSSTLPSLGASGAIAAVMGAFLVTYPRDRIRTIIFFGFFIRVAFIPAALLIGVWFLIQLLSVGTVSDVETQTGGVAYLAHIGGCIFGALTARLFEDRDRIADRDREDFSNDA
jgi:membrane associated rhomboid family serine protease